MFCITKWCKSITDSGRDEYTHRLPGMIDAYAQKRGVPPKEIYHFRLLDDDGVIYAYGASTVPDSFGPLDAFMYAYGCTEIQYKNPETGRYETL